MKRTDRSLLCLAPPVYLLIYLGCSTTWPTLKWTVVNNNFVLYFSYLLLKPPLAIARAASCDGRVHLFVCLSVCPFVCLSVCRQIEKKIFSKTKQFRATRLYAAWLCRDMTRLRRARFHRGLARPPAASRGPWLARRLRRARLCRDTRTRARTYHD